MREEIGIGMSALESRLTNKMDEQFIQMKQDLEQERSARTMLEERVAQLESKQAIKENTNDVTEAVDKSIAVIGGFGETTVEEAEKLAHDLLKHMHGFVETCWPGWLASFVDSIGNTWRFAALNLDFAIALW